MPAACAGPAAPDQTGLPVEREREFFIDNLLVRIHLMRWTGLAPWEFEFPFQGSLTSTVLCSTTHCHYRDTSLIRNSAPLGRHVRGQPRQIERVCLSPRVRVSEKSTPTGVPRLPENATP